MSRVCFTLKVSVNMTAFMVCHGLISCQGTFPWISQTSYGHEAKTLIVEPTECGFLITIVHGRFFFVDIITLIMKTVLSEMNSSLIWTMPYVWQLFYHQIFWDFVYQSYGVQYENSISFFEFRLPLKGLRSPETYKHFDRYITNNQIRWSEIELRACDHGLPLRRFLAFQQILFIDFLFAYLRAITGILNHSSVM